MSKAKLQRAKSQIERGLSAATLAIGVKQSPFFRFPFLKDSEELVKYVGGRNVAIFSTDIDSFDFKIKNSKRLVRGVMRKLKKRKKGIILMHDIQPVTVKALPDLLTALSKVKVIATETAQLAARRLIGEEVGEDQARKAVETVVEAGS